MRGHSWLVCVVLLTLSVPALAQGPTEFGLKPYGSFQGGNIDSVNLMDGMLNVHIPLVSYAQRGGLLHLGFYVDYQPGTIVTSSCGRGCRSYMLKPGIVGIDPDFVAWYDPDHALNSAGWIETVDGSHPLAYVTTGQYVTADATAIKMATTALSTSCTWPYTSYMRVLTDSHGIRYTASDCGSTFGVQSIEDPNGNKIVANGTGSQDSGVVSWTDTLGRTIPSPPVSTTWATPNPTTTTNYSGCTGPLAISLAYLWSIPAPGGGTATYKICTAGVAVSYDPCANVIDPNYCQSNTPANFREIQSIVLPNGTAWTFEYDSTYGNLEKIVFPTGGSLTYTRQEGSYLTCGAGGGSSEGLVGEILSRTLDADDGTGAHTWTYSYALSGTYTTTTTVTDPLGDQTVHTFTGLLNTCNYYETEVQYPLKTVSIAYHADYNTNVGLAAGAYNVVPTSVTTSWPDGQVEQVQKSYVFDDVNILGTSGTYASYGNIIAESDYNFGSGSPGSLLRKVDTTYEYQGSSAYGQRNLVRLPAVVSVYNGAGALAAKTTYSYDQFTLQSSGVATQHDSSPPDGSYRGNLTSVGRWLNTTGGYLTHTNTYYDTGAVYISKDPLGHATTYQYSSAYAGAYATKITDALGYYATKAYDFNTGLLTSAIDPNNRTTSYSYDLMERPTQVAYPDTGQTTLCYTDEGGSTCSAGSPPYKVIVTKKRSSSQNVVTATVFDGLGRKSETEVLSDPAGTDYVVTTYDALGRISTVTNPYRSTSDPTYGVTRYQYDALSRVTQITNPDNSTVLNTYSGPATEVQDEGNSSNRVTRISQTDALGRLISVCEVTSSTQLGSSGTPSACGQDIAATGFLTTYSYDALGNLTGVSQAGLAARTFQYNSLSELTSASNPESGTTTYSYDADGNLTSRTAPKPNQTSSSVKVTTTYSYDALDRLLSKTYSDGTTPGAYFTYDASSEWGTSLANPVGRLVHESSDNGHVGAIFSYDAMGRVVHEWECAPVNCGTGSYSLPYTYDLLGGMLSSSNGRGTTYTYGYNAAEELTSVTSSYSDANHPGALFSSALYNAADEITSGQLGNGVKETWGYNSRLRETSFNAGSVYNLTIGYAPNGDVDSVNDSVNGKWTYTYDGFNRMNGSSCSSHCPNGQNSEAYSYAYDRYGNMWHGDGGLSISFSGGNNRIDGYSYDAAGNLLNDGAHSYAYDAENRLVSVDGGATTYVYDASGQKVAKVNSNGDYTNILDLSGRTVAMIGYNGVVWRDEIYSGARHLATYANSTTYFDHADWLGTERVRSSVSGASCETITSLPFGDGQTTSGSCGDPSPNHFTGKERDGESNLDHFDARYYGSSLGRFTSPDPGNAGAHYSDPQTWNMYAYALNDPSTLTDPTGLYVCANDMTEAQCNEFQAGLEAAQRAANALKQRYGAESKQYKDAQRAIDAYGKSGVDNGVTIHVGKTGKYAAFTKVKSHTGRKTKDNPTGQIINVTINSKSIGNAPVEAHEGSHVADGSAWVASGFSGRMDPTMAQTEIRAYQVEAGIVQGLGSLYFNVYFGNSRRQYLLELDTLDPMSATSDWLIKRILRAGYSHLNDPAFR